MIWTETKRNLPETKAIDETLSTSGWILGFWNNTKSPMSPFGAVMYEIYEENYHVKEHWINEMLEECTVPDYWSQIDSPFSEKST